MQLTDGLKALRKTGRQEKKKNRSYDYSLKKKNIYIAHNAK